MGGNVVPESVIGQSGVGGRWEWLRDSGGECFAPCEARNPKSSQKILRSPAADCRALRARFGDGSSFSTLWVKSFGCSRKFPWPGVVPRPSREVQLMVLEPGSQTQALEQDRSSEKDSKMTLQTRDLREAAPMASGLRGRVLRTI